MLTNSICEFAHFNLHICALNSKNICEFAHLSFHVFVNLPSYKNFLLNIHRKGIYLIWLRLYSRKFELKQQVKVSLAKHTRMFCHDCSYNIRFIFTNSTTYFWNSKESRQLKLFAERVGKSR